ncbi:MAG: AsmA family protein [Myxococcales bacterium]|nr:AsmA family protein [Myxococcales bacterium]
MRKALKVLAILLVVFVAALGIFLAVFDLDETINTQKDEYLPELEKALGRKVDVGAIKTTLMPVLGAEIRDVKIAGAGTDGPPVQIKALRFGVGLWDAIKSAGSTVALRELVVDGLVIDVTRHEDGSLNIDDILKRLAEGPPPEEAPKPLSPEAKQFLQNLTLKRVAIENAAIRFRDEATGGEPALIEIGDLLVEIKDAALVSPIEVTVSAALFGASKNLEVRTRLGPLPIGEDKPLAIEHITVKLDGLDVAPVVPYLGEALPIGLKSAQITGGLKVTDPLHVGQGRALETDLSVAGLAFEGGKPFAFGLKGAVATPRQSGRVEVSGLAVQIDAMKLNVKGNLTGLTTGRMNVEGFKISSEGLHFGELMARLPPLAKALPPGAKLDGPFTLSGELDGDAEEQRIAANVDLGPTLLRIPGAIAKPAGTPLGLQIDVTRLNNSLEIRKGDLNIGPMALTSKGKVLGLDKTPRVDIQAGTGRFSIDGLVRLLPAVSEAVPPDVKVAGQAEITVRAKGDASAFDAAVDVQLTGADLRAPGATLVGSGGLRATAKQGPAGGLAASLSADLSGLTVKAGDAVDKAAGVPTKIDVQLAKSGDRLQFGSFEVILGPLHLTGRGGMAQDGSNADVSLKLADFELAALAKILPGAIEGPMAQAKVGVDAGIKGNLAKPETVSVDVSSLRFALGRSQLSGTASVKNGPAPVIRFDLNAPQLHLDEIAPPGPEEAPAEEGGPVEIPEIAKVIDARGRIRIGRGSARGYEFNDFDGQITLQNGRLSFQKMDFRAFDGTFSAARTVADLRPAVPQLKLRVDLRQVNAALLLTQLADMGDALQGRLTTTVNVDAAGLDWPTMSKSLSGALNMQIIQGRLKGASLEQALFDPVQARLPLLKGQRAKDLGLESLAGSFEVKDGQMRLKEPMSLMTPQGPMTLNGAIGLDQSLDLVGTVQVAPALVARISGGKINPAGPIPVGLKLAGTLTDPKFGGVEVDKLATALLTAAAGSQVAAAKAEAERLAAEAKARAQAEVDQAKARAQAEADKAKARAQAEADKAKARAKAEADKAKKKASDKAKKALKGLF